MTSGLHAESLRRKIKLVIAYDGTDYHGWQIQPGFRTVQGTLCEAAAAVLRCPTHVQGASRTDAGVHAQGQVGLLETAHPIPVEHLAVALNERLPRDIAVLDAREVGPDFDVMADVTRKAYRYTICTGRLRPVQRDPILLPLPGRPQRRGHAGGRCATSWGRRTFARSRSNWTRAKRPCGPCFVARLRERRAAATATGSRSTWKGMAFCRTWSV